MIISMLGFSPRDLSRQGIEAWAAENEAFARPMIDGPRLKASPVSLWYRDHARGILECVAMIRLRVAVAVDSGVADSTIHVLILQVVLLRTELAYLQKEVDLGRARRAGSSRAARRSAEERAKKAAKHWTHRWFERAREKYGDCGARNLAGFACRLLMQECKENPAADVLAEHARRSEITRHRALNWQRTRMKAADERS